ncbi:MAG: hypothetical protein SH856_02390 [Flavobacteriales bacterium]|nr:hypothetical protein [Flavobacteriales bacterium]
MNSYYEIVKHLNAKNVRYMVAGGFAANIYGVQRGTRDIDLIIEFEKENLLTFEQIVKSLGFRERVPVFARDLWDSAYRKKLRVEHNMLAFSYHDIQRGVLIVDVILNAPRSFEEMWNEKHVRYDQNIPINLVSIDHLIEMKAAANREQDQFDIVQLKRIRG